MWESLRDTVPLFPLEIIKNILCKEIKANKNQHFVYLKRLYFISLHITTLKMIIYIPSHTNYIIQIILQQCAYLYLKYVSLKNSLLICYFFVIKMVDTYLVNTIKILLLKQAIILIGISCFVWFQIMLLDLLDLIILNIFLYASMKHTIEGIKEMNQQFRTLVLA